MYFTALRAWNGTSNLSGARLPGYSQLYSVSLGGRGSGRGAQWALQLPRRRGTLYLGTDGVSRWGCVVGSLEVRRGTVGVRRGK